MQIIPVILCGGKGERLWPISSEMMSKPFLNIIGNISLYEACLSRITSIPNRGPSIILSSLLESSIAESKYKNILSDPAFFIEEPASRNTAPAIALASFFVMEHYQDNILLIIPADQHIPDSTDLNNAIHNAFKYVSSGSLCVFGIKPKSPYTGYGYIKIDEKLDENSLYRVEKFTEKPSQEKAELYIKEKNFLWNTGILMVRASKYLEELKKFRPSMFNSCKDVYLSSNLRENHLILSEKFMSCPNESVDFAIMENTKDAITAYLDFEWSDLGTWDSVSKISNKDQNGNVISGNAAIINGKNNFISSDSQFLAVVGLSNIIAVSSKRGILLTNEKNSQQVKEVVRLCERNSSITKKPWGFFELILQEGLFKIKKLLIKQKQAISLQLHQHRSEHWVIVQGKAEVTIGEQKLYIEENKSVFIPKKTKHRLCNVGDSELIVIEVQYGEFLGEEDIIRYEDKYNRH